MKREIPEADHDRWGAFAAGIMESCPNDWPPDQAWARVMDRICALGADVVPPMEDLRRWAASWATKNLPPEVLLRRRWF